MSASRRSTAGLSGPARRGPHSLNDHRILLSRSDMSPMTPRLLTLSPDHEPLWVRLSQFQRSTCWAAIRVAAGKPPGSTGAEETP